MLGTPGIGMPQSLAPFIAGLVRQARLGDFSADQIDALTYGRGMDTDRFARAAGFTPAYTSRSALEEFAASAPAGMISPERIDAAGR